MREPAILFEDKDIIVANKPDGMLSEEQEGRASMPAFLRSRTGREVFTVHRLDRTTHGLMVYARNPRAAAVLSDELREGRLVKIYLAVVEGIPDERGELSDLLYFDRARNKSYAVKTERRGVKKALLSYERLAAAEYGSEDVSLVRVTLKTGRTHQIRVQFASRRHPIAGDRKYGSRIDCGGIALCSSQLSLAHPATGEPMSFTVEPEGRIFEAFY